MSLDQYTMPGQYSIMDQYPTCAVCGRELVDEARPHSCIKRDGSIGQNHGLFVHQISEVNRGFSKVSGPLYRWMPQSTGLPPDVRWFLENDAFLSHRLREPVIRVTFGHRFRHYAVRFIKNFYYI